MMVSSTYPLKINKMHNVYDFCQITLQSLLIMIFLAVWKDVYINKSY